MVIPSVGEAIVTGTPILLVGSKYAITTLELLTASTKPKHSLSSSTPRHMTIEMSHVCTMRHVDSRFIRNIGN